MPAAAASVLDPPPVGPGHGTGPGPVRRRYAQVDVFGAARLHGNPLAVVIDGDGLDDDAMQRLARWTQLSETTFLLPPTPQAAAHGADYRVRIWTPGGELPFAGHPTLGSCHAWLGAGGVPRAADTDTVVQECGVGLVTLRRTAAAAAATPADSAPAPADPTSSRLAFEAPPLERSAADPQLLQGVLGALGADPASLRAVQWLDNGPRWLGLLFDRAETVLALEPDHAALKTLAAKVGVVGPWPAGSACAFEVRAFAAAIGIAEDPVTGSLNASLAQWLIEEGRAPESYVAAQGTRLGRAGRVQVERSGERVWIGGACATCIEGSIRV